jgi:hypothetical protein
MTALFALIFVKRHGFLEKLREQIPSSLILG